MPNTCIIGESDPFVAHLLQRYAEKSGLQVLRASLSQDVLGLIRQSDPAVVVLDAELPGEVRGWEIIRILRAEPKTSALPIISCSWLSKSTADKLMGKLAGHLQKPELHYEDFLDALEKAGIVSSPAQDANHLEKDDSQVWSD